MRADITVIDDSGLPVDYRVEGPDGLRWADLTEPLAAIGLDWQPVDLLSPPRIHDGAVLGHRRATAISGPTLQVVAGIDAGTRCALQPGQNTIGRDATCTLELRDPDVSRVHLELDAGAREITVQQCHVANSATRNGEPITARFVLRPEDWIRVGSTVLRLGGPTKPATVPLEKQIVLPRDPGEIGRSLLPWGVLVSVIAAVAVAVFAGSGRFLLFAALGPLMMIASMVAGRARSGGGRRSALRNYRAELATAEAAIRQALDREAAQRRAAQSDPIALRGQPAAQGNRGLVRLGLGRLPAQLNIVDSHGLSHYRDLDDVPVTCEFGNGGLSLAAPAELARGQARWVLCQLAASLSPSELAIALSVDDDAAEHWRWARWLPHLHTATSPQSREAALEQWKASAPDRLAILIVDGGPAATGAIAMLHVGAQAGAIVAEPVDDTATQQLSVQTGEPAQAFTADAITIDFAEAWAREIAGRSRGDNALPATVHLLDLLGLGSCPDVAAIESLWLRPAAGMSVPIGLGTHAPVTIDLDRDGPHALIAGTTGSGKSELLRTLVLGLAARHPPNEVQFLLVDYKGGSAFGRCVSLPHTAGVVTDLDATRTARALRSLTAELRRRERLLADADVADFHGYLRAGRHPTLGRLVVIVDEFATLAAELPDFVHGLVGVAQRGRSLGMHLILATQRPGGCVSPEIRANANLRIALRTITTSESIDVIDCPDAARLDPDQPGRAIQSGPEPQQFQIATITGRRAPTELTLTRLDEWRVPIIQDEPSAAGPPADEVLANAIASTAAALQVPLPPAPWLPPLPDTVAASSLECAELVPFALVDLPDEQRRDVFGLDLDNGGVVVIAGGRRSGRSSALLSAAMSAASTRSADQLHVHVLDFAGGGLRALDALPHSGTIATAAEPLSLASALIARLTQHCVGRREMSAAPAVLLLIDDFGAFCNAADAHDLGITTARLRTLLSAATGIGVTVLVTGDRAVLGPQLTAIATDRIVLRCADDTDYQLAGISPKDVSAHMPPGRGIRARDGAEVQCLLGPDPATITGVRSSSALRLRALPTTLSRADRLVRQGFACLGLGGDHSEPVWLDLAAPFQLVVAGPHRSGKSSLLGNVLAQADKRPVMIAAAPGSPLAAAANTHGARLLTPNDADPIPDNVIVLIDDLEQLGDPPWAASLGRASPALRVIAAGASDRLLTSFRGFAAEVKRWQRGIVLQPSALDGELIGLRLARSELGGPPGRGIAVGAPEWGWPTGLDQPPRCEIQTWSP